jgi:hypothetical protein
MIGRTTVIAGTFALGVIAGVANAQTESRPRSGEMVAAPKAPAPAARKPPRIAFIPPSPPVPSPTVFQQQGQGVAYLPPTAPSPTARVAQIFYLPTLVLTDGRVFADFGRGRYEQVLRRCAPITGPIPPGFATAACWTVDQNSRYSVIQQR